MSEYVPPSQFTLRIPDSYSGKYDIKINNTPIGDISNYNIQTEGLRITSEPKDENLPKFYAFFDSTEVNIFKNSPDGKSIEGQDVVVTDNIDVQPENFTDKKDEYDKIKGILYKNII